jgi:hypothetical protein
VPRNLAGVAVRAVRADDQCKHGQKMPQF